jgi:hypothetical protein
VFEDPRWEDEFGAYVDLYQSLQSGSIQDYHLIKEFRPPAYWEKLGGLAYKELKEFRISVFRRIKPE